MSNDTHKPEPKKILLALIYITLFIAAVAYLLVVVGGIEMVIGATGLSSSGV